jgi:hypothetical protein
MRQAQAARRSLVWLLTVAVAAAGAGCGGKPPYRVSEPPPPTAGQLKSLGRIDLAPSAPGVRGEAPTPRVWIGVPDRRGEGAVFGAGVGAIIGAIAGALIGGSGGGGFAGVEIQAGAVIGALVGAPIGGVIGALLNQPGAEARLTAEALRRHAAAVDVSSLARDGASSSTKLQAYRDLGPEAGPGGTLSVEVVAYGIRAAALSKRARPFVAVRTRLANASTGRVIYESTSDLRGEKRKFHEWSYGEAADFRRELETLSRELGKRSADRALTPRRR